MISDEEEIRVFMDRRLRTTAPLLKQRAARPVKYYKHVICNDQVIFCDVGAAVLSRRS
jgi:hypothetical protein